MGLLTCGRPDCGCTMTAELKKGKYIYYRCTGFKGHCGNTYIRQEEQAHYALRRTGWSLCLAANSSTAVMSSSSR